MSSLASRIVAVPPLANPEAEEQVAGLAANEPALATLFASAPRARDLLVAAFAGSSYLRHLSEIDPQRLSRLLAADPEPHHAAILRQAANAVAGAADEAAAMHHLRRLKQETALLVALADLGGLWTLEQVTRTLSATADVTLSSASRFLLARAVAQNKMTSAAADPAVDSGWIVLAMGKHGAGELNYSSDIDLIVFHDSGKAPLAPGVEPGPFFVRMTKALVRLVQDYTADGYAFRVDLRLRPDPGSTTISIDLDAALQYYESMGQNWERAALIKARPVAGDLALGEEVLRHLQPFIFRKYFDFAAISDVHAMKRQIHAHRGHGEVAVEGHDIKLGRGGIREIEFFAQTQQLIAGGRDPSLRGRETIPMLHALARAGWIADDARDELEAAYRFLRGVEHRLQMIADEQTHTLPRTGPEIERVARLAGLPDRTAFAEELKRHLRRVERHYSQLFESAPGLTSAGNLVFTGGKDDPETLETLRNLGFAEPKRATEIVRSWHFGRYPAMRSEKARERLTALTPALLEALGGTDKPDAALVSFDRFLAKLPAGMQFFSLIASNPGLLRLLAVALGTAPRLAERVIRRPHALDALLEPDFFGLVPDRETLATRLAVTLGEARSYEDALDRARIFADEQKVLIGMRVLSDTLDAGEAGQAYAALADVVVSALHRLVGEEFAARHGRLPGGASAVVALGKLGSEEMAASSDLDLIVLYDFSAEAILSDGEKPLSPSQYYARFTQRLVAALSAPTAQGRIYEVDLRLRPSGRAGPLATALSGFSHYQRSEAWTWEHMALTRARVVAADPGFGERAADEIRSVLLLPRDPGRIIADMADMRARVARDKRAGGPWDIKLAPGGMMDLEFIAQALQLVHAPAQPDLLSVNTVDALARASRAGLLPSDEAETLLSASRLQHALTQVLRLCLDGPFDPAAAPPGLKSLLARTAGLPDFTTLDAHLQEMQKRVGEIFRRVTEAA